MKSLSWFLVFWTPMVTDILLALLHYQSGPIFPHVGIIWLVGPLRAKRFFPPAVCFGGTVPVWISQVQWIPPMDSMDCWGQGHMDQLGSTYLIPVGGSNWVLLMGSPTKVLILVWFWFLNLLWLGWPAFRWSTTAIRCDWCLLMLCLHVHEQMIGIVVSCRDCYV